MCVVLQVFKRLKVFSDIQKPMNKYCTHVKLYDSTDLKEIGREIYIFLD